MIIKHADTKNKKKNEWMKKKGGKKRTQGSWNLENESESWKHLTPTISCGWKWWKKEKIKVNMYMNKNVRASMYLCVKLKESLSWFVQVQMHLGKSMCECICAGQYASVSVGRRMCECECIWAHKYVNDCVNMIEWVCMQIEKLRVSVGKEREKKFIYKISNNFLWVSTSGHINVQVRVHLSI